MDYTAFKVMSAFSPFIISVVTFMGCKCIY